MSVVKVTVTDYNSKNGSVEYRLHCDKDGEMDGFTAEMTLDGAKLSFSCDISAKLKERASAFFDALNEAFFVFCESDSNRDKLGFDFYFNGK